MSVHFVAGRVDPNIIQKSFQNTTARHKKTNSTDCAPGNGSASAAKKTKIGTLGEILHIFQYLIAST